MHDRPLAAASPTARDAALPGAARLLGPAGLLPFVALALACWVWPGGPAPAALAAYGAVILAFLGAVHWGLALAEGAPGGAAWGRLGLGVVPALLGWVGLLLPLGAGLLLLAVAIPAVAVVEGLAARRGLVPRDYLALRAGLSAGAALSLVAGAGAVLG